MNKKFNFRILSQKGHARAGIIRTPHGEFKTPTFMPVGTVATVKALSSEDLSELQAGIILANTYHLYLRPGMVKLKKMGGLHEFMNWQRPILTDSGGFQVFSLGQGSSKSLVKISPQGVKFSSHLDGRKHFFTPKKAIQIQQTIGADIIMAFDQCTPDKASLTEAQAALNLTQSWALECLLAWEKKNKQSDYENYQALFGIVQGAMHKKLRQQAAKALSDLPFDGLAVGGETIGYNMAGTVQVMDWIRDILPIEKPHYSMGVGLNPQDLIDATMAGFDMFDCVAPTRIARNGALYVADFKVIKDKPKLISEFKNSRLNIGNSRFSTDSQIIQNDCDCSTCKAGYSRAYLHHLYKAKELSFYRLASIHNLRFLLRLSESLQNYIMA